MNTRPVRHFLSTTDLTPVELRKLFRLTKRIKTTPAAFRRALMGKTLGMIFQKPSTRTRVSFEVGMYELGGHAVYLNTQDIQLSRGETVADTARVLGRYTDFLMARVSAHGDVETLAAHAGVPVVNALSDLHHPCQALADLFTVWEKKGRLKNLTVAFVGDGNNNVTHSLLLLCAQLGVHFAAGTPASYRIDARVMDEARKLAKISGAIIRQTDNPEDAVEGADVLVTDVWVSMGRTDGRQRKKALRSYQLNQSLVLRAKSDAIVLHCLPAHRGEEITDEVIDGPRSAVWDEAENRLHTQKALLLFLSGYAV